MIVPLLACFFGAMATHAPLDLSSPIGNYVRPGEPCPACQAVQLKQRTGNNASTENSALTESNGSDGSSGLTGNRGSTANSGWIGNDRFNCNSGLTGIATFILAS